MTYHQPHTIDAAVSALHDGARVIAGGTDYYPALGDGLPDHDVIDLTRISDLRGISATATGFRIGATTTWTDVLRASLPPAFDGLKAAAREVGSIQIQNTATLAGNLCNASPAADGVPPLLTLDASVELTGPGGVRTLPLADFLIGPRKTALAPSEFLSAILVDHPPEPSSSSFVKLGARRYLVISIAMIAVLLSVRDGTIAEARVAVGACSPVARRLGALEADLAGRPVADLGAPNLVAPSHLSPLSPIDDVRGSGAYRREAVLTLIGRALHQAAHGGPVG